MRAFFILGLLFCGVLLMGGDCRKAGVQCVESSDCASPCEGLCADQQVESFDCANGVCVCECGDMAAGGSGGLGGTGGVAGSGGAGGSG